MGDVVCPRPASFYFSIIIPHLFFFFSTTSSTLQSSTLLHICFSAGHPYAHHILHFSKCFCFHLLYFPVHPPTVTSLFLASLGTVQLCLCVCVCVCVCELRMLTWFPSHLHANFIPAISFKSGPWLGNNTCSQPPRGEQSGPNTEAERERREDVWKEEKREKVGRRRRREDVSPPQLPSPPPPRCETCHSAGDGSFSVHAWGINLYQERGQRQSHWNNDRSRKWRCGFWLIVWPLLWSKSRDENRQD